MRTVRISIIGLVAAALLIISGPGNATAAPPWGEVVPLTTDAAINSYSDGLSVTANARGDAVMLWWEAERRGSAWGSVLRATSRLAHGAWSSPQRLLESSYTVVPRPHASISSSGEISVLVQAEPEPSVPASLHEVRGHANGTWSAPEQMVVNGQPLNHVTLGRDAQTGHDVAAWYDGEYPSRSVLVSSRTGSGPWAAPTRVGTGNARDTVFGALAVAVRGTRAVVGWGVQHNNGQTLMAAIDSGSRTWPTETVRASLTNHDRVTAAFDVNDDLTMGWVDRVSDSTLNRLRIAQRGASGWTEPVTLGSSVRGSVSVAARPAGGLIFGYASQTAIAMFEPADDGRWRQSLLNDQASAESAGQLELATDEAGNLAAAWLERRTGGSYVSLVRTRPVGTSTWTPATTATGPGFDVYTDPHIAISGESPLAAWFFAPEASGPRGIAFRWIDQTAPIAEVRRPVDTEQVLVGGPLRARFSCSDDQYGTGLEPTTGCVAQVERPDGSTYSVLNEQLLDTEEAGTYTVTFTARDRAGNTRTVERSYVVLTSFPPDPGPGPGANPDPGPGAGPPGQPGIPDPPQTPPPGDPFVPTPPAPPIVPGPDTPPPPGKAAQPCVVRGVRLLAVQEQGRGTGARIRVSGVASRAWSGRRVDVRLGSRRIARTTVRRDGTIRITARRPSNLRSSTYRLAVGRSLSNRVKATRRTKAPSDVAGCR